MIKMFCGYCKKKLVFKVPCKSCRLYFCSLVCCESHKCPNNYYQSNQASSRNIMFSQMTNDKGYSGASPLNKTFLHTDSMTEASSKFDYSTKKEFFFKKVKDSLFPSAEELLKVEGSLNSQEPNLLTREEFMEFDMAFAKSKGVIGMGSYGSVYQSRNQRTGENFAIKHLIKERLFEKEVEITQIYREIQFHSMLNHPNIIKLYSYYVTDEEIYMVMSLMEATNTFDDIINKLNIDAVLLISYIYYYKLSYFTYIC